jgi:hypothetical protein
VLARGFDQGVEQGDDGPPQDVGDALVDAGVEGGWVGRGRVFHRLCARQVLDSTEILEGPQFFAGQQPVTAGFQLGSVVLDE